MLQRLVSMMFVSVLFLALGVRVNAQDAPPPVDPASQSWQVEVRGVVNPTQRFAFFPDAPGGNTGRWINFDANGLRGYGLYTWDPISGVLEYVNLSGDGGGSWIDAATRTTWVTTATGGAPGG